MTPLMHQTPTARKRLCCALAPPRQRPRDRRRSAEIIAQLNREDRINMLLVKRMERGRPHNAFRTLLAIGRQRIQLLAARRPGHYDLDVVLARRKTQNCAYLERIGSTRRSTPTMQISRSISCARSHFTWKPARPWPDGLLRQGQA